MSNIVNQVVEEHNLIRTNPQSYIPFLEKEMSYFKGTTLHKPGEIPLMTNEGKGAYEDCINFLKMQKPLNPLEHSDKLSKAAQEHANDIGPKGACSHSGSDGSSSSDRIERYVQWQGSCAENISFGHKTGRDIVMQLILDDGQYNRGHRKNIFSNDSKFIGVGFQNHRTYKTCCVIDYVGGIAGQQSSNKPANYGKDSTGKYDEPNYQEVEWDNYQNPKDDNDNNNNNNNNSYGKTKISLFDQLGGGFDNNLFNGISGFNNGFDDFNNFGLNNNKVTGFGNFGNDDPDRPPNVVSTSVKTVSKTVNGKTVRKSIKVYTMSDGSQQTVETEDNF